MCSAISLLNARRVPTSKAGSRQAKFAAKVCNGSCSCSYLSLCDSCKVTLQPRSCTHIVRESFVRTTSVKCVASIPDVSRGCCHIFARELRGSRGPLPCSGFREHHEPLWLRRSLMMATAVHDVYYVRSRRDAADAADAKCVLWSGALDSQLLSAMPKKFQYAPCSFDSCLVLSPVCSFGFCYFISSACCLL